MLKYAISYYHDHHYYYYYYILLFFPCGKSYLSFMSVTRMKDHGLKGQERI